MKFSLDVIAATAATVFTLASPAQAATVINFSHTDNPGGSRQAAAERFAEKVAEYTEDRNTVRIFKEQPSRA